MSEPVTKKSKPNPEDVQLHADEEDENEFGLNSSDLEDLLDDSDTNAERDDDETTCLSDDTVVVEYTKKYPKVGKFDNVKICIEFIKLLEDLKIDSFSCYDLEIEKVINDPNYIIRSCDTLEDLVRRDLWDVYCRNVNVESGDEDNDDVVTADTEELKFVEYLKRYSRDTKMPKFYTDFNRLALRLGKKDGDTIYSGLCKTLDKSVRQELFTLTREFDSLSENDKIAFCVKKIQGLKLGDVDYKELVRTIKQDKLVTGYVIFLLDEEGKKKFEESLKL